MQASMFASQRKQLKDYGKLATNFPLFPILEMKLEIFYT